MHCEDNAKLRIPLKEVCDTTDIGCVPIVNGKPTCNPQPDELPIAFDQSSTTLWLFSCKSQTWVAFKKFRLDELSDINLDNIRNICDVLNIAVWYDSGSAHVQGTVTLGELAEQILKCIRLKTNAVVVNSDTAKISIQGLESLPPFFVKGENIWFTGGSGTETDPFKVKTHNPICKWPKRTQAQVNASSDKFLGACVDGEMARVPFIDPPCSYPGLSQEQVDASSNKTLIACVDGKGAKVPYIESDPPICELPLVTTSQVSSNSNATMAVCLDGKSSRMPVPSGMFVPEYICVPKVTAKPTSPPDFGTGPLRMGCDDELYVWLCEENRWQMVTLGHNKLPQLDINDVADPCNNLKFFGWYRAGSEECNQNRYVTLCQLAEILQDTDTFNSVVNQIATEAANICKLPTRTAAQITQAGDNASVPVCVDGNSARTTVSNLATVLGSNSNLVNSVTNSSGFGTKINEIVKNDINNNTNNLTTTVIDKVVASNRLQNPICSLGTTTKASIESNWSNVTVPLCENGVSKRVNINAFTNTILDKYEPPDGSCNLPFSTQSISLVIVGGSQGRTVKFTNITMLPGTAQSQVKIAVYDSASNSFVRGSGTMPYTRASSTNIISVGKHVLTLKNTDKCIRYFEFDNNIMVSPRFRPYNYGVTGICTVTEIPNADYSPTYNEIMNPGGNNANIIPQHAYTSYISNASNAYGGSFNNWESSPVTPISGKALKNLSFSLTQNQTKYIYITLLVVFSTDDDNLSSIDDTYSMMINGMVNVRSYRGLII